MKKYAAIDIGTNSVRLAIGECRNGRIVVNEKKLITSRLGEGTAFTDVLDENAMNRTIDAINIFVGEVERKNYELIGIYATSAVREASNQVIFLNKARKHGLEIEVLSGEAESMIAFRGVTENRNGMFAVADIGGGSTEISFGCDGVLKSAKSTRIGAVRMTQMFAEKDGRVLPEKQEMLLNSAMESFSGMSEELPDDAELYGVGGTFTTLAAMNMKMIEYDSTRIQGALLSIECIHDLRMELCELANEQRIGLPGLLPRRADIIACASLIAESVMMSTKRTVIRISERDGLDGYMNYKFSERSGRL